MSMPVPLGRCQLVGVELLTVGADRLHQVRRCEVGAEGIEGAQRNAMPFAGIRRTVSPVESVTVPKYSSNRMGPKRNPGAHRHAEGWYQPCPW